MLMQAFRNLVLAIAIFASTAASATNWKLVSGGHRMWDYDRVINQVRAGDNVDMEDRAYHVVNVLGSGNTTKIFDVGGGYALRVPLALGLFRGKTDYQVYIQSYLHGYNELKNSGIKIVKVYPQLSRPPMYLIVERVTTSFDLDDYVNQRINLTPENRAIVDTKLREFAKSTAAYNAIGDFHIKQLRWTGHDWILMDYTAGSVLARMASDGNVFSQMADLPENYRTWLTDAITKRRTKYGMSALRAGVCANVIH